MRTHLLNPRGIRLAALALAGGLMAGAAAPAQMLQPGDILVANLGSQVQRYNSNGALQQTYTGPGNIYRAASLTPDGNVMTTFENGPGPGVAIFSPSGSLVASINTPAITAGSAPGDVSAFADGTLAVNDQNHDFVHYYTQAGALVRSVALPAGTHPFGSTVSPDNTLYVAGLGNNTLNRIDEGGTVLSPLSLSFTPGDVAVSSTDSTLWVTDIGAGRVFHLTASGTVLGNFPAAPTEPTGIGIDPAGNLVISGGESSSLLYRYSPAGVLLNTYSASGSPEFLSVVPAAVPEPSALLLVGAAGTAALAGVRRRRRARAG